MKRVKIILLILTLSISLVGCSNSKDKEDTKEEQVKVIPLEVKLSTPLETAETFMRNYYFDEGTYEDYQKLFLFKDNLESEKEFNDYRSSTDTSETFGEVKIETIEEALTHLKEKKIDENTSEIYFLNDPKDEELKDVQFYWILKKENEKWLMDM